MAQQCEACEGCKFQGCDNSWTAPFDFNYHPKFLFVIDQYQPNLKKRLTKLLDNADFDTDNIEVAFLTRCWDGVDNKGQIKEGQKCKALWEELVTKVPKDTIIVPMGATPCKVIAKQKSIQTAHGVVIQADDRVIIPTLHPGQVIAYPDSLPTFLADLDKIRDAGNGVFQKSKATKYQYATTIGKFKKMIRELWDAPHLACDIESSSLNAHRSKPHPAKVLCFSFSSKSGTGWCVPIDHRDATWTDEQRKFVKKWVKRLMERVEILKIFHNGQFDTKYIRKALGIRTANWDFDTMLAHAVGVSEEKGTHYLKILAWEFTDMGGYDDPLEAYKAEHPEADPDKGGTYDLIPLDLLMTYAVADADCTFRLFEKFQPIIDEKFYDVFYNIVMPATRALADIEYNGAPIDKDWHAHCKSEYPRLMKIQLDKMREFPEVLEVEVQRTAKARRKKIEERKKKFKKRYQEILELEKTDEAAAARKLARLQGDIRRAKDRPVVVQRIKFNPKSTPQKIALFEIMGWKHPKRSKTGGPSTDAEVLKDLWMMTKHPILQALGKYTKLSTLYGMFVKNLDDMICDDGRLRGGYHVAGTETGRLSCSDPNLQQIPKNPKEDDFVDALMPSIKRMFAAPEGYAFLLFDYSQAELRVLAALSREPTLLDAYAKGEDVHARVAAEVFGVPIEEVTSKQRDMAKKVNFGLLYGQGAKRLARALGIEEQEAKDFIDAYFKKLPRVKAWIKKIKRIVRETGESWSPFGRVRRLAAAFSPEQDIVAKAERQGVNAPVQSAASDCTLQALDKITRVLKAKKLDAKIILTVHDSIGLLVKVEQLETVYKIVKYIMEHPTHNGWLKDVVMVAEAELGQNWGQLSKIESLADVKKVKQEKWGAAA